MYYSEQLGEIKKFPDVLFLLSNRVSVLADQTIRPHNLTEKSAENAKKSGSQIDPRKREKGIISQSQLSPHKSNISSIQHLPICEEAFTCERGAILQAATSRYLQPPQHAAGRAGLWQKVPHLISILIDFTKK